MNAKAKSEEKGKRKKKKDNVVTPKAIQELEELHSQTQQALEKMTAESSSKMAAAGQVCGILFTHASPVAKAKAKGSRVVASSSSGVEGSATGPVTGAETRGGKRVSHLENKYCSPAWLKFGRFINVFAWDVYA